MVDLIGRWNVLTFEQLIIRSIERWRFKKIEEKRREENAGFGSTREVNFCT